MTDEIDRLRAELDRLKQMLASEMKTRSAKPDFKTFVDLKYGIVGTILAMLQDGQISRGKAAEALAEVAHGVEPRLPASLPPAIGEDVVPSSEIERLRAELAEARRLAAINADEMRQLREAFTEAREDTARLEYIVNLRSAYWIRRHGWRLIETDCGAMRLCGEGETFRAAIDAARGKR